MQFWDLKMSKIAVADCSGVGDVVMPKHSFMPRPSEDTRIPPRHSIDLNQSRSNAVDKRNSGCLVPVSMSALGQKQTYAVHNAMSALPPIATTKADSRERLCLLYPHVWTAPSWQGLS